MRRRTFLLCVGGGFVGAPLGLGCGEGAGEGGREDADLGSFVIANQDDSGHSHELTVLCADLAAGDAVSYTASGPHQHTVMLSESEVLSIAAGEALTISFTEGHSHTFVIVMPEGACGSTSERRG